MFSRITSRVTKVDLGASVSTSKLMAISFSADLILLDDSAVSGIGRVVDDRFNLSISTNGQGITKKKAIPPFGPVEEIVVKESPRNKSSSLAKGRKQSTSNCPRLRKENSRSKLLQLIRALTLIELNASVQLFLQPREVPRKRSAISDMRLAEAFELGGVLDGLEIGNRGSGYEGLVLSLQQ